MLRAVLPLLLLLVGSAPAAEHPDPRDLLDRADDLHRGDSSHARVTMRVKTDRWDRTLSLDIQSRGEERSLIKILSPAKEAGMATLKVEDNIWNYLPKVDRTMKVPAGMMSGAWMGSHFTNDDLVKESRMAEDYSYAYAATPDDGGGLYVVRCLPRPDAPVVWGEVKVAVDAELMLPTEITYWDEDGELVRTMRFSDIVPLDGRPVPMRMILIPADAPDEFTELVYDSLEFDVDIPDSTFSLQALKR